LSIVFISYSSRDRERCARIVETIENAGIRCWVAPRDISPGALWMESVTEAVDNSSALLLLVTAFSNDSNQVRRELERAISKSKIIVPMILDEVQFSKWMQYSISIHHWHTSQCSNLSRDLQGIIASLKQINSAAEEAIIPLNSPPVMESLLDMFSVQIPISLTCRFRFTNSQVPEKLLFSVQHEVNILNNRIMGTYRLSRRYTEKKTELAYSLDSARSDDDGRARILSAAIELLLGFDAMRNMPSFLRYQLDYSFAVFPSGTDSGEFSNDIKIDFDTEEWLRERDIQFPGNYIETLSLLEKFINKRETVLPECELVGRANEVASIMSLVEKQQYWHVDNPRGYATHLLAGICGAAGIGKTALLNHIEKRVSQINQVSVVRGSASSGNLWLSVLSDLLGVENPEGVTGDVLQSFFRESYGTELSEADLEALVRFCSRENLYLNAEQNGSSVSVQVAFRNLFTTLADVIDIVFLLEDIHNADSFSLEVFRFLIANTERNRPLVFIISFRPDMSGENVFLNIPEGYFIHESLDIVGLDEDSQNKFCVQLLSSVKSGSGCSSELLEFVNERAQGNPLYIRELLENLLQKKVISLKKDKWELSGEWKGIEFSQNLKQVYDSKLQNLEEKRRLLLKCLSVLGERFSIRLMYGYLERIAFENTSVDSRVIDSLAGFLRTETSVFRRSVVFSHALLREHLYGQLTDEQKKPLHAAAARILEEHSGSDPGDISVHFSLAGEKDSALIWGEKKLELLKGIHDNMGILSWTGKMLRWISEKKDYAESEYLVRQTRFNSLSALGKKEERKEELDRLGKVADLLNDRQKVLEVKLMLASFLTQTGSMAEAGKLLSEVENAVVSEGHSKLLFKLYDTAGRHYQLDYNIEKSMIFNEKALDLAESKKDEIRVKQRMASIIDGRGEHKSARRLFEDALNSARAIHSPVLEISVMNAIAQSYFDTGDWGKAEEHWERAIKLSQSTGSRRSEAMMLNLLGHMLSKKNSIDDALQMQLKALEVMEESGNRHGISKVLTDLGIMYTRTGQKDKAIFNLERSLEFAREMNNMGAIGAALANISNLQKDLGDYDAAEKNIREAVEIWHDAGFSKREAACIANLGSILERKGEMNASIDCFKEAMRIGEECGDKAGVSSRSGNLAVMMQIKKNWAEAEKLYDRAIKTSGEIGNTRMQGMWTGYKATLLDTIDRDKEAILLYKDSLSTLSNVGDEPYLVRIMGNYSALLAKLDEDDESLKIIKKKLDICCRMGYKVDEASALCSLAHYHLKNGEHRQAFNNFRDTCLISKEKNLGIHMFRGIMPLYRVLKKEGFSQVDEYFPDHWGNPDEIARDNHMPEKKFNKT